MSVKDLEQQLSDAEELIARKQMVERLAKNKDFKTIILDGFMRDEAARYVQLSADPALAANERADALGLAQASGHLKRFLQVVRAMGVTAEREMDDLQKEIEEARTEELEEASEAGELQ